MTRSRPRGVRTPPVLAQIALLVARDGGLPAAFDAANRRASLKSVPRPPNTNNNKNNNNND